MCFLLFSCASVFVGCCQSEGPTGGDEEESEKSVSEVNDEDDDEEGSAEVFIFILFPPFSYWLWYLFASSLLGVVFLFLFFRAGGR